MKVYFQKEDKTGQKQQNWNRFTVTIKMRQIRRGRRNRINLMLTPTPQGVPEAMPTKVWQYFARRGDTTCLPRNQYQLRIYLH